MLIFVKKMMCKHAGRVNILMKIVNMKSFDRLSLCQVKQGKCRRNTTFALINAIKTTFPVSQKCSLCYKNFPCVFPVLKKWELNSLFSLCRSHSVVPKKFLATRRHFCPTAFGLSQWLNVIVTYYYDMKCSLICCTRFNMTPFTEKWCRSYIFLISHL